MSLSTKLAAALCAVLFLLGSHWYAYHAGDRNGTNALKVASLQASNKLLASRAAENKAETDKQLKINSTVQKAHDDELAQVRANLATAKRLRIGTAICPSAGQANAKSTTSGNAADTGGGEFRADMDRDIRAAMMRMEEAAATGRACQKFVTDNGMAP